MIKKNKKIIKEIMIDKLFKEVKKLLIKNFEKSLKIRTNKKLG